jgi:RNA polymerase sigma factor (TIGR02999 family)
MTTDTTWGPEVHAELRSVAQRLMNGERRGHTLQPTALVHEAWLKIAGRPDSEGLSRERFVAAAVTAMRHVLVDCARRRGAARRDGGRRHELDGSEPPAASARDAELVALDDALENLANADAELARLVELRVFGRHGVEEIATLLGLSPRTVKRRWRFARSWLAREIARRLP